MVDAGFGHESGDFSGGAGLLLALDELESGFELFGFAFLLGDFVEAFSD
jgi:hypothetical protein